MIGRYGALVSGLLIACLFLMTGCSGTVVQDATIGSDTENRPPDWFADPVYPPGETLMLVGYGQGASPEQAQVNALEDVSRQLGVTIRSDAQDITMEFVQNQQSQITEEYTRTIRAEATHHIKDWRVRQSEQTGDRHFVEIVLDRRPAPVVIAEKIRNSLGSAPQAVTWQGPETLINGDLTGAIESNLLSDDGKTVSVELHLERLDERWYLRVRLEGDESFHVVLDEPDFAKLFGFESGDREEVIQLSLRPLDILRGYNRLRVGDYFVFEVATRSKGYVTLFNIYEDGRISILDENLPAEKDASIKIPTDEEQAKGAAFMAFPIEHNHPTQDLYLAVLSTSPLPTSGFQRLLEESPPVEGESSYQIHRLLRWLDEHQSTIKDRDIIAVQVQP